jgi:PAS domain S-box-containing protein
MAPDKRPTSGDTSIAALALAALEAIPDASVMVFDAGLRYLVARGPGIGKSEILPPGLEGRAAVEAHGSEWWAVLEPLYRAALKGDTRSVEVESAAEKRWYRLKTGPLRGPAGGIVGGVAFALDITEQRLADERYFALFDNVPDAMVVVDRAGLIRLANPAAGELFGYPGADLIGASVETLLPARFRDHHRGHRGDFNLHPRSRPMGGGLELMGCRQDGSEFPVDVSLSSTGTNDDLLVTAVIRDIEADAATAASLTLLESLQESAPVGIVFVDRAYRIQRINATLAAIGGAPIEDQVGRLVSEIVPALWPQLEPKCRQVLDTGEALLNQSVTVAIPGAPGPPATFLTNYFPVRVRGETVGIGVITVDITDRQASAEFRQAVMDNMAEGLYVLDGQGRLDYVNEAAIAMLGFSFEELRGRHLHDLIHFQHADGSAFPSEECEIQVARASGHSTRKTDDAYTRKDGTIFPIAYSGSPLQRGTLGTTGHEIVVAFHDISDVKSEQTRGQRELDTLAWVGRVRDALDEDRMVLYSQPILPLSGGEPGEELLIRMVARDGGLILPGSFLPAAEKYGLVGALDRWVITQAVRLASVGRHVHVNLSAASVGNLDVLNVIREQIGEAKADPSRIVFEITETALMGNLEAGEEFCRGINELGASVSLDDFGTGFGSFTYLKHLSIRYLKIDVDFVRDLGHNEANQHLVQGIVNLAKGFGLHSIAEGVEDAETLQLLRGYEVDFAQGYFIGRPAPTEAGLS